MMGIAAGSFFRRQGGRLRVAGHPNRDNIDGEYVPMGKYSSAQTPVSLSVHGMRLNASQRIIYSEAVTAALIYTTLVPYILMTMNFTPLQLFHYVNVTLFILTPLGFITMVYFSGRWECRPIEMLSFYLERRLTPPDDVMAAAKIRTLNLPLIHSASILIRYEIICLLGCLYMGTLGDLSPGETAKLGISSGLGIAVFPILSFFLTERFLYPVRRILAEQTRDQRIDESTVILINTHTRLITILLVTVMTPLVALGVLVYRWVSTELSVRLADSGFTQPVIWQLSDLIFIVTLAAFILAAGIGLLLSTSISAPLGHMVATIRQLEKGNLRARMNIISNDEIGVVSRSFDTMALRLEQNQTELENLNRTLEVRVAEKTENLTRAYERLQISNRNLAIANRELEEANTKLKEIDQMKSDFISIVSHELRTPLTSIKAFTELIVMKPKMPADKRNRLLSIINNETDRLTRLINDILDLTRIEAGNFSWRIERLSMDAIVRTSVSGIQSLADNKGIAIVTEGLHHSVPNLFGDRDRLMQVITNILSNSIKFTPPNGKITITLGHEESPQPRLLVAISDTGVGIPEEDHDLIFEKFRRSGDILTSNIEGTGLGLSIARQIVTYHGGKIWVKSKPGEGSTFTFALPLDKVWHNERESTSLSRR
jgi:signal transduction histidine kinase